MTDLDTETSDDDSISLMTMHTAKGLEFPCVFLCGLEEGIIPSPRAFSEKEREEERRLFYVAITRAKERLYLSCASQRFKNGVTEYSGPSRFIAEVINKRDNLKRKTASTSDYASSVSSIPIIKKEIKKGEYDVGDKVEHLVLGKGIIRAEIDGYYIIEFENNASKKKIIVDHPLLKKCE